MPFDPFEDFEAQGYLRNFAGEKDPIRIQRFEHHAFAANVLPALRALQDRPALDYPAVLHTHRILFGSVYPWAGQDRAQTAPGIAITKGDHNTLFAHPRDIRRAVDYALGLSSDRTRTGRPGEALGALFHAHPFLDGNGRALLTVHTDLARRAGYHIDWPAIPKQAFLSALTDELYRPGHALDRLLAPHIKPGPLILEVAATQLTQNPNLGRTPPSGASTTRGPAP